MAAHNDAVNMFYDSDRPAGAADDNGVSQGAETSHNPAEEGEPSHETHQISEGDGSQEYASVNRKQAVHTAQASSSKTNEPSPLSSRVRLITWNIDGLDENCRVERTQAVCEILDRYAPDIIFLQEVILETCKTICSQLSNYKPFPASDEAYFTLILLRKSTVTCLSDKIESFPDSAMLRALQIVDCKCAGIDLRLMSSHLESTSEKRAATERQKQFSRAVHLMETAPPKQTVLFGGDTNLRDKEVEKFCLPTSIHDVWEMIGSPSESRYTWDQTSNDNKVWPFPNRSRLRFDRLYLRHPETMSEVLAPNTFDLLGRERLSCNKFPSDHWGIVCDFQSKMDEPENKMAAPLEQNYNIWNMRGTKANTNGPRKRRNERSNNSQEIPTTAATNTMTTMEEGTDMIDQSDVYVNRTASTGSRSSRRKEMRQKKGLLSKCFHVGKYVLLVLILPAILNHASLYREAAELKPKGELYDVGWNHKLQLNCAGSGAPTVVLDAPTGMTSDVWCLIQPRIAKFTRVCSYDRAGLGFSERTPMNFSSEAYTVLNKERGQPSTVERMAEDLYHLLRFSSDQPLPFILVGSEIGSLNARFFTQMYESAVADLVLVDPLVEGMFELDDGIWNSFWFEHLLPSFQSLQLSAAIGLSRIVLLLGLMELPITGQVIPEDVVIRQKYLLCQPRHLSSIVDEHYFINQSLSQLRTAFQIKPFPESVSVTVITGNYYDDQLPSSLNKVWAKSQQHLMSKIHPNAKHILINGADHHMLYRNPNAIVEPVRKLVKQWRARNTAAYQRSLKTNTDSPPSEPQESRTS